VDQGRYFERVHLKLDSRRGCATRACDMLHRICDIGVESVGLEGRIYRRATSVLSCVCVALFC